MNALAPYLTQAAERRASPIRAMLDRSEDSQTYADEGYSADLYFRHEYEAVSCDRYPQTAWETTAILLGAVVTWDDNRAEVLDADEALERFGPVLVAKLTQRSEDGA